MKKLRSAGLFLGLLFVLNPLHAPNLSGATPFQTSNPQTATKPSGAEIAAAKAAHKVWVNLQTGIYHKGGRWYGKTKNGKFMTVDEAKKAGYKPAKRD